ncbi:hypothetical protein Vafri_20292 [Volvox africanus]|uniref:WW domain-containing protein n=1 Tax=Volvox africanus TaxID=51714 RepID=A0A8J4FCY1_9CHLO|nr:hypothetical protein Vafri_20292 [Volvox africanus]
MEQHSPHTQTALPAGWACAFDQGTGHWYYYNQSTGATSWTPPQPNGMDTSVPQTSAVLTAAVTASSAITAATTTTSATQALAPPKAAPVDTSPKTSPGAGIAAGDRVTGSGWYYRDRGGVLHGPFQQEHLRAWRAFLPMDLLVWYAEIQPPRQQLQDDKQSARGRDQTLFKDAEVREGCPRDQQQQQQQVACMVEEGLNCADAEGEGADAEVSGGSAGGGGGGSNERDLATAVRNRALQRDRAARTLGLSEYGDAEEADDGTEEEQERAGGDDGLRSVASDSKPPAKRARHESTSGGSEGERTTHGSERLPSRSPSPSVTVLAEGEPDRPVGRAGGVEPSSAEEAIACGLPGIELAELLGDGQLLADWRQRFPGNRPPGTAPPAAVHDQWLRAAAAAAAAAHAYGGVAHHPHYGTTQAHYGQQQHYAQTAGENDGDAARRPRTREESMLEYAEAVLAGLPPDDEAVVLARQAAAAGKSLAEVVNFSWAASTSALGSSKLQQEDALYGAAPVPQPSSLDAHGVPTEYVRDPRSGRLTAVGCDAGSAPQSVARALYGEYGGWVNPDQIEDYLAKAKRWRQEQLPALWARKKLKEQKEARAKKAARTTGL